MEKYDTIIVGNGPAGLTAAIYAMRAELKTLVISPNPAGGGQAEGQSKIAEPYDIPLRCLIPQKVEGLFTAGRCISGSHRAHASYRVMGIAMATGQAAGLAAALCAEKGILPSQLDYRDLQKELQACGAELFEK